MSEEIYEELTDEEWFDGTSQKVYGEEEYVLVFGCVGDELVL